MIGFFIFLYALIGSGVFIAENEKAKGVTFTKAGGSLFMGSFLMAVFWPILVGLLIAGKLDAC